MTHESWHEQRHAGSRYSSIGALRETLNSLDGATRPSGGLFFLLLLRVGVYSGVDAPPYDERSPLLPLSHYGRAKLEAESLVTEWSQRNEASALIGRIANLYGPGQNISKPQGIIRRSVAAIFWVILSRFMFHLTLCGTISLHRTAPRWSPIFSTR